ncbi:NAD(P)H-binding protein (plasmid) [Deinococcus taeanensis]|uniref:SDR family oxidoreductase n=1 Tax=Deinococcus taeanensis TaxID=2737050 RepID=UPI001CDD12B7|nr:NAD(P)H-binding protein [Deinococcus taeanensis]UBV44403.1 NAD(P)H-binding protein [Deinococcus taeanensis]
MTTVLITGATGQLGRHVIPHLLARGAAVRALSRQPGAGAPGLTWIQGDLRHPGDTRRALTGADTLLHLATQPLQATADLTAAQTLTQALTASEVRHAVYMSITGLEGMQGLPYYQEKLAAERLFETSGVPFTVQRATQFHEFVAQLLERLTLGPLTVVPSGVTLQPVAAQAVAGRLAALTLAGPAGRVQDLAGPEPLALETLARQWQAARGHRTVTLSLPLPVPLFRAWRGGGAVSAHAQTTGESWGAWLGSAAPAVRPAGS